MLNKIPRPEHPNPQWKRESFVNLNGEWMFEIDRSASGVESGLIDAETEAQRVIIDSHAQAIKRKQEGYTYQDERDYDVATEVARNEAYSLSRSSIFPVTSKVFSAFSKTFSASSFASFKSSSSFNLVTSLATSTSDLTSVSIEDLRFSFF